MHQIAESFSQEQNGNFLPPYLLPRSHTHCILHHPHPWFFARILLFCTKWCTSYTIKAISNKQFDFGRRMISIEEKENKTTHFWRYNKVKYNKILHAKYTGKKYIIYRQFYMNKLVDISMHIYLYIIYWRWNDWNNPHPLRVQSTGKMIKL